MSSEFVRSMGVATRYRHTQHAPLYWVLVALGFALPLLLNWLSHGEVGLTPMLLIATPFVLLTFTMASLTTVDGGDHLLVHYGPLPLFRKRLPYARMTAATPARTSWVDGWGIHYIPRRGWTYNLWGFDCVRVELGSRRFQIGTDDPDGLANFLNQRIARSPASAGQGSDSNSASEPS